MSKVATIERLRAGGPKLSVGLLAGDMMNLGGSIALLEEFGDSVLLHFDVMDGQIWSKITFGAPVVAGLESSLLKDVHLLIAQPERQIDGFVGAGADIICFSIEQCGDIGATLTSIKAADRDIVAGVSLDPSTPVDSIAPFINNIDMVTLLAVGPTTGKQTFIDQLPGKIAAVKELKQDVIIAVDGAVTKDNIADIAAMGPHLIVTGSAAFAGDPTENIRFMLEQISG